MASKAKSSKAKAALLTLAGLTAGAYGVSKISKEEEKILAPEPTPTPKAKPEPLPEVKPFRPANLEGYKTKTDSEFSEMIGNVESQGRYDAVNPQTGATGKYQFIWGLWGKPQSGQRTSFVEKAAGRPVTQEEFLADPELQEKVWNFYKKDQLEPQGKKLAETFGIHPDTAMALVHFKGYGDTVKILKGEEDPTPKGNLTIAEYLEKGGFPGVDVNVEGPRPIAPYASKVVTALASREKPQEGTDALAEAAKRLETSVTKETDFGFLRDAIEKERQDVHAAVAAYKEERDSLRKRELFDKLANLVGELALGIYGLNNSAKGINVGGTDFSPQDWSRRYADAKDDLNSSLSKSRADRTAAEDVYKLNKEQLREEVDKNKFLYSALLEKAKESRDIARDIANQKDKAERLKLAKERLDNAENYRAFKEEAKRSEEAANVWEAAQRAILGISALKGDVDNGKLDMYLAKNAKDLALAFGEENVAQIVETAKEADDGWLFTNDEKVLKSLREQMTKRAGPKPSAPAYKAVVTKAPAPDDRTVFENASDKNAWLRQRFGSDRKAVEAFLAGGN